MSDDIKVIILSDGRELIVKRFVSFGLDEEAIAICEEGMFIKRKQDMYDYLCKIEDDK